MFLVFLVFLGLAVTWRIINTRVYSSKMGINLVVVGENGVAVVGVNRNKESLIWVDLPSNLRIDGYPVTSIWGLGEIEKKGDELVTSSLGDGLGLWLRSAVKIDGEVKVDGLLKRLLSIKGIRGLSWLDRYTLYKDVSFLATKGVILETELPYQVTNKVKDVDGYEWRELNEAVFMWSRDLWPKEEIVNMGIKAEVFNVSDKPGKARIRARQLESVGFRVVKVETGSEKSDKRCLAKVNFDMLKKNRFLEQILRVYLGCEIEKGENLVFLVS